VLVGVSGGEPSLRQTPGSPERTAAPGRRVRKSVAIGYYVMAFMKPAPHAIIDVTRHKGKEPQGMHVQRSTTIDQPVDRVFEYVSIPENDPRWVAQWQFGTQLRTLKNLLESEDLR
jgi:hypothetical protein